MNSRIHLVVPMSGQGARYRDAGYAQPKPLIPINGTSMVERLLEEFPSAWPAHFVLAENHRTSELPELLNRLRPGCKLGFIPAHSQGPGPAIKAALAGIPSDEAVFVSYCDYGQVWDSARFERFVRSSGCDACLVSYRGFHAHYLNLQTYAYSRLQGERVVEVREKGSFTNDRENEYASSGGYYFKSAQILREALEYQLKKNLQLNGEYYTSLTVEALLRSNPKAYVRVFEIPYFFQWGTPQDLKAFEYWEKAYSSYLTQGRSQVSVHQVLMPMAGLGSRFRSLTSTIKLLIPIAGQPMFKAARSTLPISERSVYVTVESVSSQVQPYLEKADCLISLEKTPAGQAFSTEAGLAEIDPNKDVLVSSCDHGVVMDPVLWQKAMSLKPDALIFTVRGYPGVQRSPTSYAYVLPEQNSDPLSLVKGVSVKKPFSLNPVQDHLLTGTFWFRNGGILKKGIEELKRQDLRVNNELYLDSVFSCLKELGYTVRLFTLDGYLCWGDPLSMAETLYWYEVFAGRKIESRSKIPALNHG